MKLSIVVGLVSLGLIVTSWAIPLQQNGNSKLKNKKDVIVQAGEDPDPQIRARREFVKQMMIDAWEDYIRWACEDGVMKICENQLKPVSQRGENGGIFGESKIGATIVDSLDTLYIMELMDEYESAKGYVIDELDFNVNATVSVFETNIRFVGGFLSAYALTQEEIFMTRALEIATLLLPAFDTPTGIPYRSVNILSGVPGPDNIGVLAEYGTLHLEFTYLSEISGNPIFKEKVDTIRQFMKNIEKPEGLYPNHLDVIEGTFTDTHISIGALGDSFYEYLLKAAIQFNETEAREMYDDAMDGFFNKGMVKSSAQNNLLYIAESNNNRIDDVVGHLACFAGGMFKLGSFVDPSNRNAPRDNQTGTEFTTTCHESYIRTETRIGPEVFRFSADLEAEAGSDGDRAYILRPEVIESYYVMYRTTGDPIYRDWAWDAAQQIERYCKAGPGRGYSGLRNTNNATNPIQDDVQQTFFLAETLKYLYLIFSTNDLIALDEWVMNTECHPLPIRATNPLY